MQKHMWVFRNVMIKIDLSDSGNGLTVFVEDEFS
jgi:hypothetical protein